MTASQSTLASLVNLVRSHVPLIHLGSENLSPEVTKGFDFPSVAALGAFPSACSPSNVPPLCNGDGFLLRPSSLATPSVSGSSCKSATSLTMLSPPALAALPTPSSPPFTDALTTELLLELTLEIFGLAAASFPKLRTGTAFPGAESWRLETKQARERGCNSSVAMVAIAAAKSHGSAETPSTPYTDRCTRKRRFHVPIEIPYPFQDLSRILISNWGSGFIGPPPC